jgi:hypothetical protein
LLRPLGLGDGEKSDLVAFLESLSMDEPLVMATPSLPPMLPLVILPDPVRGTHARPDRPAHLAVDQSSGTEATDIDTDPDATAGDGAGTAADSGNAPPRIRYNRYTRQVQRQ